MLNHYHSFIGPNQLHGTRDDANTAYWYYLLRAAEVGDRLSFPGEYGHEVAGSIEVQDGKLVMEAGGDGAYALGWWGIGPFKSGIDTHEVRLTKADGTRLDTESKLRVAVNGKHAPSDVDYVQASAGGFVGLGAQVTGSRDRYHKWRVGIGVGVGIGGPSVSLTSGNLVQESPPDPGQLAHALDGWGMGIQGGYGVAGGCLPIVNDGPQPWQIGLSNTGLALTVGYTWGLGER